MFLGLFSPASRASACRCWVTVTPSEVRGSALAHLHTEKGSSSHRDSVALLLLAKRLTPALWLEASFVPLSLTLEDEQIFEFAIIPQIWKSSVQVWRSGLEFTVFYSVLTLLKHYTDGLRETHKPELFE